MPLFARRALVIFAAAFLVRGLVCAFVPASPLSGDGNDYDRLATGLSAGHGYVSQQGLPTASRPPLYAVFLAAFFRTFGHRLGLVYLFQGLLDAANCVLIYAIARLVVSEPAAWLSGLLAAGYVSFIAASRMLLSETLFLAFFLGGSWYFFRSYEQPKAKNFLMLGFLMGLATLTRGTALLFPLACLFPFLKRWRFRQGITRFGIVAAAFALSLVPWTARNWRVFHEVVPVATQTGKVFYSSYLPPEGKLFGMYANDETVAFADSHFSEAGASRYYTQKTKEYLRKNPKAVIKASIQKLGFLVVPFDWELLGQGKGIWNFGYGFVLPFAVMGMAMTWRMRGACQWLWVIVLYFVFLSVVFYGSPRMRLPIEPCLLVWAAVGLLGCWEFLGKRVSAFSALAASCLAANVALVFGSQAVKALVAGTLRTVGLW